MDSNHRPRAYQARALATWATDRYNLSVDMVRIILGGDDGVRTHDPLLAGQVLSQLSYTPDWVFEEWSPKIEQQDLRLCKYRTSRQWLFALLWIRKIPSGFFPILHRKEVIQPHLPIRLPCYDLTPIIEPTLGGCLLAVSPPTLGVFNFHGLTGGVYKARERIHRGMLTRDY